MVARQPREDSLQIECCLICCFQFRPNVSISEEMYRRIVEAVPQGIWVVDPQGRTVFSNRRMADILGVPFETMDEQSCFACVYPEELEDAQRHFGEALGGDQRPFDFRLRRADGSPIWVSISCMMVLDAAGAPVGLLGLFSDIRERKLAEAALRESEERFRNMADTAPVMMWVSDENKQLTFLNKTWLDFTGRTLREELGSGWADRVHPDDLPSLYADFSAAFDARKNFSLEHRMRRADGEYRWVLCRGVPRFAPGGVFSGYIGSDIDITDMKRAQDAVFARQKWESLGALTGGIAHDFNNLLGGILAEAELAESSMAAGSLPGEEIEVIKGIAIRAAEIVRELMVYSGQDRALPEPVEVSQLVEEMLELLKVSISKTAVLKTDLAAGLAVVMGNAAQIRQVVMNLMINASEAVGTRDGVIHISTSRVAGSAYPAAGDAAPPPAGEYLMLQISDSGCGMTEGEKARIFDPFFTTKFAGRGLGLAVVQGIVRAHGGGIHVESTPGRGTTFQIFFPCGDAAQEKQSTPELAAREPAIPAEGTVLLVEDEDSLRYVIAKTLRKKGFSVLEASDGVSAIELFRSHENKVDVILLDMTIPGCSSQEVLTETAHLRPEIKVILMSAYSKEMAASSLARPQIRGFIRKPFQVSELLQLLRGESQAGVS